MIDALDDHGLDAETATPRTVLRLGAAPRRSGHRRRRTASRHPRPVREVLPQRLPQTSRIPRRRLHPSRDRRLHPAQPPTSWPRTTSGKVSPTQGVHDPRPVHRHRHLHRPAARIRHHHPRRPGPQIRAANCGANEIMLLAYYIACVNIEATYEAVDRVDGVPAVPRRDPDRHLPDHRRPATAPTPASSPPTTNASNTSWPPTSPSSSGTRPTRSARRSANDNNAEPEVPHPGRPDRRNLRRAIDRHQQEQPLRLLHPRLPMGHRPARRPRHRRVRLQRRLVRRQHRRWHAAVDGR